MIDWKSRFRNKTFWVAIASGFALLLQQIGFNSLIPSNYTDVVNTILSLLTIVGIIIDPSTKGLYDSEVK